MKKEIAITIFSKDRACQVSACIKSLYKNFSDLDKADITVLYKSSDSFFKKGYQKAISIHSNKNIRWISENSFRGQLLEIVSTSDTPLTMFLVDDDIFVNKFSLQDEQIQLVKKFPAILAASLRLHSGVTHCYPTDQPVTPPKFVKKHVWEWTSKEGDWGYPLSVDGNVYRTDLVRELMENLQFANPNSLEAAFDSIKQTLSAKHLCCYPGGPRLINIPVNLVQNVYKNRFTGEVSAEELNRIFLGGREIDIQTYQGIMPNTVHVPIEIKFKMNE